MILPLIIGAALGVGPAAVAEEPRDFVERLYAQYRDPGFNPIKHPGLHFTPRLAAALKEDARLANGEVGYLDGDPVCQCQDPAGLNAKITSVKRSGHAKAEVRVLIGLSGYEPRPATFSLLLTRSGWRIADVSSPDDASLLHGIEESNRKQRVKH